MLIFVLFTCAGGLILSFSIPDSAVISKSEIGGKWIPKPASWLLSAKEVPTEQVWHSSAQKIDSGTQKMNATIYLCGIIPVKNVEISVADNMTVMVGGQAIGINLKTKGILVAGTSKIDTGSENRSPAEEAGIRPGDIITRINGEAVTTTAQVSKLIKESNGALSLSGSRGNRDISWQITPCADISGNKKLGMWIRDSVAGIGTLTFYTQSSFGALGHPISDIDTGEYVQAGGGNIYCASVIGVDKGKKGVPGSLKGIFSGAKIGEITGNCDCGVFGISDIQSGTAMSVAYKNEIKCTDAQIRCDIGNGPENFAAKIIRLLPASEGSKGMVIEITDKRLIDATGGIVQGMSGSPIIQNDKIAGAVTHVFVNDPTRGYGIFIENMLAESERIK